MSFGQRLVTAIRRRCTQLHATVNVWRATKHLHGPKQVVLGDTDTGVVCLVKDAAYFIETFIRHHQALGAAHILLVDNGSDDDTVQIARRFAGVTIVLNTLAVGQHECRLRSQSARRVFRGGWLLFVDADELFEIPLATGPALPRLTAYLNAQGYTAMVAQMLDLFSQRPYAELKGLDYPATIAAFRQYSLNRMTQMPYHDRDTNTLGWFLRDNTCDDAGVMLLTGGVRSEMFGETPYLFKHSLVRNRPGIQVMTHPHCASGVVVADVTGLLRHYKLAGAYMDRDRRTVAKGTWTHSEDRRRVESAVNGDGPTITVSAALEFDGTQALLDHGFLYASARYRRFMTAE